MRKLLTCICVIVLFLSGCKEDSVIPPDPYFRHYFPANTGSYIVYDCDSIVYNDFTGMVDTFRFEIREFFESSFTDNAGRSAIRLERWKKNEGSSWNLKDVWSLVKTDIQVEKVEEDVRYIRLMFPVKKGKIWNMNALNSSGTREVEIIDAHGPFDTGYLEFDSTLTVQNTDPANLVSEFRNTEIYAVHTGLVYKQFKDVRFIIPTPTIKSGVIFTMRAKEIHIE
jgi:hypothetical protein